MLNWFRKDKTKDYRSRIKKSFPRKLDKDLEVVLDIIPLDNDQVELNDGNIHKVENLIYDYFKDIKLDNENLSIPYRVYFNEPNKDKENSLTDVQKAILNCIYLKHHNGFIRQKRLELLGKNYQYWTTPYTFQLLGNLYFRNLTQDPNGFLLESNYVKYSVIERNPTTGQTNEFQLGSDLQTNTFSFQHTVSQFSEIYLKVVAGNDFNFQGPVLFHLDNIKVSEVKTSTQTYDTLGRIH